MDILFAFWAIEEFPFVAGGRVSKMHSDGCVSVRSIAGRHSPLRLLPEMTGRKLLEELERLEAQYQDDKATFEENWRAKVNRLMPFLEKK